MLQQTFTGLTQLYTQDDQLIKQCWQEIEKSYSFRQRHYHTLAHLQNLLQEMQAVRTQIRDWDTVLFTLFYHDIVYKARRSDNEEKSAELAVLRLQQLKVPGEKAGHCEKQILATKKHVPSGDLDTDLFTDADLSILGKSWPEYEQYFRQVRKEYAIYPDLLYKPGRKKILEHFLSMPRIFKTDHFFDLYERSARENLGREIEVLR